MKTETLISRGRELVQELVDKISHKKNSENLPSTSSASLPVSEAERESLGKLRHFVLPDRSHS